MLKKTKMRDMPVVTIHLEPSDKQALKLEAEKRGLQLIPYCRMLLLASLNREDKK